jgi:hypothetical protein
MRLGVRTSNQLCCCRYKLVCLHHSLTVTQLVALARAGFEACFATPTEKRLLLAQFDAEVRALRAELSA